MSNGITAWSFSRLSTYRQCPQKLKFTAIDKLKDPGSAAMDRGTEIHKECENYLRGLEEDVPASAMLFKIEMENLLNKEAWPEQQFAFRKDWTECAYFAKDVWLRVKIDAIVIDGAYGRVIDFKTGKVKPDGLEQLELCAIAAFIHYPHLQTVDVELWFLDHGIELPGEPLRYRREALPRLKAEWEKKVRHMFVDTRFMPTPSMLCGWCHFRKDNGGPCQY